MKDLFAELKAIADMKSEIAKTELHLWQRLSKTLNQAARMTSPAETQKATQVALVRPVASSRYLNAGQAAKYLGISRTTLYRLRNEGILKCVKLGSVTRYKIDDLDVVAVNIS